MDYSKRGLYPKYFPTYVIVGLVIEDVAINIAVMDICDG